MKKALFLIPFILSQIFSCSLTAESNRVLDFPSAYQRALALSSTVKATELDLYATDANYYQVSLHPNPQLSFIADSIGSSQSDECNETEYSVMLSQSIDFNGKRAARMRLAEKDQQIARWNQEIAKLELKHKLFHAFIDAALAQYLFEMANDQKRDAEETLKCVMQKMANGKLASIDEMKAKIVCHTVDLTWYKTHAQFEVAKKNIALLLGIECPDFDTVSFPLCNIEVPMTFCELEAHLSNTPERVRAEIEITKAYENIELNRSLRIPDISISAGITAYPEDCPVTFAVGFNIPLPLFDRNQGNISRAQYDHLKAEYHKQDLELHQKGELSVYHATLVSTFFEAKTIKENILPAALEAYQMAKEGFHEGKFEYMEMLNARKVLFETNSQYLDAVSRYHHTKADIERLITCIDP